MMLAARLKAYWSGEIPPSDGATEKSLREFEIRYGVRLPADMREYLAEVDGMGSRDYFDEDFFTFWPICEFERATEYFHDEFMEDESSYFVFADCAIGLPCYAIRLTDCDEGPHLVLAIYSDMRNYRVDVVATSFTEFAERYLDDESRWQLGLGMPKEGFDAIKVRSF